MVQARYQQQEREARQYQLMGNAPLVCLMLCNSEVTTQTLIPVPGLYSRIEGGMDRLPRLRRVDPFLQCLQRPTLAGDIDVRQS